MDSLFQGLVLGAVQGVTEWLPISSKTFNVLILLHFFQKTPSEAIRISLLLHTGTLMAALIYFRRDIGAMLRHLPQYVRELGSSGVTQSNALITFLIISTLLAGAVGAPLLLIGLAQQAIPTGLVMAAAGVFLIITGLVQKYAPRSSGTKTVVNTKDALVLGVVEGLSVFPGLSRSGLTVSAFLFRGYEAKQAIRVSFLMSIPFVLGGVIGLNLLGGVSYDLSSLTGVVVAFLFGLLTISALLKIAARVHFWKFCVFLGGLTLLASLGQWLWNW